MKASITNQLFVTVGILWGSFAAAQATPPFGTDADVSFAGDSWTAMVELGLVGPAFEPAEVERGFAPHGAFVEIISGQINVGDEDLEYWVKRNYGGEGISRELVEEDRQAWLKAVTFMVKRPGYDPDNQDWFWVKYMPTGDLFTNPAGIPLAGRVAKGSSSGCISCHKNAPGDDYVFKN